MQAVIKDDFWNFNSAVWYLEKYCSDKVKAEMKMGTDNGFNLYVTECINTGMDADRQAYWKRAKDFFGLKG